jgi:hypothetical protein
LGFLQISWSVRLIGLFAGNDRIYLTNFGLKFLIGLFGLGLLGFGLGLFGVGFRFSVFVPTPSSDHSPLPNSLLSLCLLE